MWSIGADFGHDSTLTIDGGRQVGYARFGVADGTPVVAFSGTPGSRWFGAFFDVAARELGVSVYALERPGYGRSDAVEDRSFPTWADTVDTVAHRLDIDEFGVVAFSGGGPYALACGAALSDRVTGIGLASPAGPPGTFAKPSYRAALWLARNASPILSTLAGVGGRLTRAGDPEEVAPDYLGSDVLDVPVASELTAAEVAYGDIVAGLDGGSGVASDLQLLARPWRIDLDRVTVPVTCFHSDEDEAVPLQAARELCDALPDAVLRVRRGEHHGEVVVRRREALLAAAVGD